LDKCGIGYKQNSEQVSFSEYATYIFSIAHQVSRTISYRKLIQWRISIPKLNFMPSRMDLNWKPNTINLGLFRVLYHCFETRIKDYSVGPAKTQVGHNFVSEQLKIVFQF